MTKRKRLLVAACSLMLGGVARADPIFWYLSTTLTNTNPSIAGTGSGVGSFVYDADTNTYSDWNIVLSGFPPNPGPDINAVLTPATSSEFFGSSTEFGLSYNIEAEYTVGFSEPLTDAGGEVSVFAFDFPNFSSWIGPGTATSGPEPNPAILVLFGSAILSVGYGLRTRRERSRVKAG